MAAWRALLILATLLAAPAAGAQEWATRAVCDLREPAVHENAFAPATLDELEKAAARLPNRVGRFWRVVSPDGAVSHLWGTMHSADPHVLDLPALVVQRIAEARVIAVEIDPVLPDRDAFAAQYDRDDWYRQGPTLPPLAETRLDKKLLEWIRARTEGLGWGRDAPERLTPGGLAELLLADPCNDFSAGVLPVQDGRIQMLGLIGGAEVLGLEDRDRIRHHLDAPGNDDFALDFLSVYGAYFDPATTREDRATQVALYLEGRLGLMLAWDRAFVGEVLGDGGAALDRVNAYLLGARNHGFLAAARGELARGGVFMAVGAFHLPGREGLISLMRRDGFTVTRIPVPGEARK